MRCEWRWSGALVNGEVCGGGDVCVRERLVDERRLQTRHAGAAVLIGAVDAREAERRRLPERLRRELLLRTRIDAFASRRTHYPSDLLSSHLTSSNAPYDRHRYDRVYYNYSIIE